MASAGGGDKYRSFLHGEGEENTVWRHGAPPNYDLVNKLFKEERTKEWAEGSVEEKVQRLLKTWEMEMVHKVRPEDKKSVHPKNYSATTNGLKPLTREEVMAMGGYNAFLATTLPPEHRIYDLDVESVESVTSTTTRIKPYANGSGRRHRPDSRRDRPMPTATVGVWPSAPYTSAYPW